MKINIFTKISLWILAVFIFFSLIAKPTPAVYDPLSVPNNKIGIHILFPTELEKAKELVNSNGGQWGYVTIPIQSGDKDIKKWQHFMDEAKRLKLIPILRLATHGDYFKKKSWKKPTEADIVDFANFLNSLEWPVKNRYVIVFNEVNRADEWEGEANPSEYAKILSYSSSLFKNRNEDFFIISSGMDNAAATGNGNYSQYDYFRLMNEAVPGIFNQIDGFSSHSYPNPAFSTPPNVNSKMSIASFLYETQLINSLSFKRLPVFITETGWDQTLISEKQIGDYFKIALDSVWNYSQIVAITPFLLHSGPGPYEKFSLIKNDGNKNEVFRSIEGYRKIKGSPITNSSPAFFKEKEAVLPTKKFSHSLEDESGKELKMFVKWLLIPL